MEQLGQQQQSGIQAIVQQLQRTTTRVEDTQLVTQLCARSAVELVGPFLRGKEKQKMVTESGVACQDDMPSCYSSSPGPVRCY